MIAWKQWGVAVPSLGQALVRVAFRHNHLESGARGGCHHVMKLALLDSREGRDDVVGVKRGGA